MVQHPHNNPQDILSAWTALEVLSPQSYKKPEDLLQGDQTIAGLEDYLPWEAGETSTDPDKHLYYFLVLGSINLPAAEKALLDKFTDKNIERSRAEGKVPIAYITLDDRGMPVEDDAVALSSFAWGVPKALTDHLHSLAGWSGDEKQILEDFEKQIYRKDKDNRLLPLTREHIEDVYAWLAARLGLQQGLIESPSFAIRAYHRLKEDEEAPETPLLNSFFLNDLARVRSLAEQGGLNDSLNLYLGVQSPQQTFNLLSDKEALESVAAPQITPTSCWPAERHHPLVLLQQAAVNIAVSELSAKAGVVAVNGPPGTGKTTLLRDLIAAVVTERAGIMASYDNPETAFTATEHQVKAGSGLWKLHTLDERLRGHEIIVACMNNKAVENVSKELPISKAVASDAGLRYFKTASDSAMHPTETWGLISAALGNSDNRSKFRREVWHHKDSGLRPYLQSIVSRDKPTVTENGVKRPPYIITEENAPASKGEALQRWQKARATFIQVQKEAQKALTSLEELRQSCRVLDRFQAELTKARADTALEAQAMQYAKEHYEKLLEKWRLCKTETDVAKKAMRLHLSRKPGFWARIFRFRFARAWRIEYFRVNGILNQADYALSVQRLESQKAKSSLDEASKRHTTIAEAEQGILRRMEGASKHVQAGRERLGSNLLDSEFFNRDHAQKHTTPPWFDKAVHQAREKVFVEAMNLHRAFIDAAAHPMRHNLGAVMNTLTGGGGDMGAPEKVELLPHLWSTLFLLVPVISTTFASVERMFRLLPKNAFGWLLIDEAGQATPQAAVGALMRTKRAVVVGDPLQIEPVVTLPTSLTESICFQFGVNPAKWNAPVASAQTLADRASKYIAEFPTNNGIRRVGAPLLVHRRCQSPMFDIANDVAYAGLMVQATSKRLSRIREALGESGWIDIDGSAQDHWSPEEGEAVVALLIQLARSDVIDPDLFIISPFRRVVQKLSARLRQEPHIFDAWKERPKDWIKNRIGTVHTVQGREADSVILVLGAPSDGQRGARNWAGEGPNILNVAVTRAKENLYVIGSRKMWRSAGHFETMDALLKATKL